VQLLLTNFQIVFHEERLRRGEAKGGHQHVLDAGQSLGSHGAPRKPIGPRSTVKGTRDKNTREKGTANDISFEWDKQ